MGNRPNKSAMGRSRVSTKGHMNQKQWISHEESAENVSALIRHINRLLVSIPIAVFLVLAVVARQFIVLPIIGVVVGVVVQRLVVAASHQAFAEVLESPVASDVTHARIFNVVDGLCVVSGDQRPSIVVIDVQYPLAVAAVDADGENVIGVSQSFVNEMTRVEVEAVMAHLLWRLRVGHGRLVAYVFGLSQVLSRVGLGFVADRLVAQSLAANTVTIADIAACQATRFPPAAVSALEKSESATGPVSLGAGEFLSFALPTDVDGATISGRKVSSLVLSRPLISERVAILKEM